MKKSKKNIFILSEVKTIKKLRKKAIKLIKIFLNQGNNIREKLFLY